MGKAMADFFDSYQPYWPQITSGLYSQAVETGITFLTETKRFSPSGYEQASKGTPFYLLRIAAFHSHDFQTATFLFDAAVSEDLTHQPNNKTTPALLTMQLEDQNPDQAAFEMVKTIVRKIESAISNYNTRSGSKKITINDVRQCFLSSAHRGGSPHITTLTTTFISFFFEWDYRVRLIELSKSGSREPFFTHLFRGCLLFESLLKENPTKRPCQKTLGNIIRKELFGHLGISANVDIRGRCPGLC